MITVFAVGQSGTTQGSPITGIDYMWLTSKKGLDRSSSMQGMPILVTCDQESGWVGAWVVPEKGEHWYATKVAANPLSEWRYKSIVLRSHQEPALKRLKATSKRTTDVQVVCEESPVGESKPLG